MATADDLIKAIRSGKIAAVRALLEAGTPVELDDGLGAPGLPLGIACFMGHADIVLELIRHGAHVNLADNWEPVSPLVMATRGNRPEIVRLLVERGAIVPNGMQTGLSETELAAAAWQAHWNGLRAAPPLDDSGVIPEVEEIVMSKPYGVDTTVLEADMVRAAQEMEARNKTKR